jgi:hypothetical protein
MDALPNFQISHLIRFCASWPFTPMPLPGSGATFCKAVHISGHGMGATLPRKIDRLRELRGLSDPDDCQCGGPSGHVPHGIHCRL